MFVHLTFPVEMGACVYNYLTIKQKNMSKIWDTKVSQEMTSIQYSEKVLFVKIKYIINPYYFSINSWKYQIIPNFVHSTRF